MSSETCSSSTDTVYVAVGKDFKENKRNLLWCFQNTQWKKFVILHIHHQAQVIPVGWRNVPVSSIEPSKLNTFRYQEWDDAISAINKCIQLCDAQKVQSDKLVSIVDCEIEKGIVDMIAQHDIQNLVMGAAVEKRYSQKLKFPSSRKAIYVNRYAVVRRPAREARSTHFMRVKRGNLIHTRAPCSLPQQDQFESAPPTPSRVMDSILRRGQSSEAVSSPDRAEFRPQFPIMDVAQPPRATAPPWTQPPDKQTPNEQDVNDDELYHQMKNMQDRVLETMRKEQKKHAKEKEELTSLVSKHEATIDELQQQCNEKGQLLAQISELEHKLEETMEKLETSETEKKELKYQIDSSALFPARQVRAVVEVGSASMNTVSFTEFSGEEVAEATSNYNTEKKIGEGGFGSVYKGRMRYTAVAIKVLAADSMQGTAQFNQEVNVLSRVRHPNLVTLIGASTECQALVYEYLPNGSLEDRMDSKNGRPPLPWQDRTRIAAEILSAVLFLHSHKIVHGDLKPANILLDANLSVKISDFGIYRILPGRFSTTVVDTSTIPKGTFPYMDPDFLSSGKLTTKSDLYAFGVILLQLLTGKPALWIASKVQRELKDHDHDVLKVVDPHAKDWPRLDAMELIELGVSLCHPDVRLRTTSALEAWAMLEPMKARLPCSTNYSPLSVQQEQPPSYFICPIFKEIMQDPHLAADGFTYEKEAISGWLDNNHDTSPMTNARLENKKLIPNRALRSSVQEWLQQQASSARGDRHD